MLAVIICGFRHAHELISSLLSCCRALVCGVLTTAWRCFLRLCALLSTAACEDRERVLCSTQYGLLLGIQWLPATVWSCIEGLTAAAMWQIEFECWPQACFASSGPCCAHR
jgi:hypothetical protein